MRFCSVEGCRGIVNGLSFCQKHYKRFKRYGDPLAYSNTGTGECPTCQPSIGKPNGKPKNWICTTCLDRFQAWLREQEKRYADTYLVVAPTV